MSERPSIPVPTPLVPPPGGPVRPAHLMPAHVYAAERDWGGYFDALGHLPARETTLRAVALFDADGRADAGAGMGRVAIDLGCGDGRDTLELLARGWRVVAVDSSAEGLARLEARTPEERRGNLRTVMATFEELGAGGEEGARLLGVEAGGGVDLVNASFALPFCAPGAFPGLWSLVRRSVRPGGRFAGQFFGPRDDWAKLPDRTHHSEAEIRNTLLAGFEIEFWQEEDRPTKGAEHPKHWHLFHVVGKRRH